MAGANCAGFMTSLPSGHSYVSFPDELDIPERETVCHGNLHTFFTLVNNIQAEAVIGPRAELHLTVLCIKGEILDVDWTVALEGYR